jgi:16S rRNA processing protein RimM
MPRRPTKSDTLGLPFESLDSRGKQAGELELGSVVGVFGVRGEVRVFLHNRDSGLFQKPRDVVLLDPHGRRYRTELSVRTGAGKRILGRFRGLDDRDLAASLKGWKLLLHEECLPGLERDEFYVYQIEGATVVMGEATIGTVAHVHSTETLDILEIHGDGEEEPVFVPCVVEFVEALDGEAGVVRLTPGALEEL